ncbi:MAG: polysaccharide biosynthesis tyrosine autokinase [Armatimonadetes bacterium]|nr:polysaccharide biosynthesis tyrosine autokinase [Armatimonadota bacterium]
MRGGSGPHGAGRPDIALIMETPFDTSLDTPVTVREVFGVLWRRLWIVALILAVSLGTAALISYNTSPRWRGIGQLILVQRTAPVPGSAQQSASGRDMVESVSTQVGMLQSYEAARRTLEWLRNQALKGDVPEDVAAGLDPWKLQEDIQVSSSENTNIITVQVEAPSRERARLLTDAVCKAFVDWKKVISSQSSQENVSTLEDRVRKARDQLADAEQKEIAFKKSHDMVDVNTQSTASLQKYLGLEESFQKAQQELTVEESRLRGLGAGLREANRSIQSGTGVRDDSMVLTLQQELESLKIQRANAALKFRPAYPGEGNLKDLDARIADVNGRLQKALQSTLDNKRPSLQSQGQLSQQYKDQLLAVGALRARVKVARSARDAAKKSVEDLPATNLAYAKLARDKDLASGLLTSLQAGLNAARIERDTASGNVQISQYAVAPEDPFVPNHGRDLAFGAVIGVALSLAAILLLEQTDRRIRSVEDVRRLAPGTIVGALPQLSSADLQELLADESGTRANEAYSLARANLALSLPEVFNGSAHGSQIILVTSALPGEGKSLTANQMAKSLARAGKSVILVDADMRRPTQNDLFGTAEELGLADVLVGKAGLDDALVASGIEKLSVLHSGTPDRNPSELLSHPRMKELVEELRREAEIIILDAPACAVVADSLLLAPFADCVLHVVGAGISEAPAVRDTVAALAAAAPKSMVYFVNRLPKSHRHGYSYYADYGYAPRKRNGRGELVVIDQVEDTEKESSAHES